ncbi:GyrI-like domain-containing protein [Xylanibacillus composti]|uniref:AraC family transcriptional regulator n=1 Tax=Xylanibacillus composti TaxID=1572762 RepID=A0A8J4H731_9BACL|nr:GyrI-like domain-containing protein [Xylanibacillus composti]GIQ71111.1 AraC family transcriptional regulator [Xylanibacillus composti]
MWARFWKEGVYAGITPKANRKVIGLYSDYEGDCRHPYRFTAGCEVGGQGEWAADVASVTIPGGKYAKFAVRGDVQQAIGEFWSKLWDMPLERAYRCDFEEYQERPEGSDDQEVHIYISI